MLVAKSVRNQKPFIVGYPKSKASGCVSVIANRIANKSVDLDESKGFSGFFKNLLHSTNVQE